MSTDPDRLYRLLPGVHRRRDAERGEPLRALLAVITEQVDVVSADLDQLYDDWFVETCQDWVVPYLGDLVGYRMLPGSAEALAAGDRAARTLLALLASRRDVGHTVTNRRHKGGIALLERLAVEVAGWPARAVEFHRLLAVDQPIRRYGVDQPADAGRRAGGRLVDLRAVDALDRAGGPFDELAHTVELPRITSPRRPGRYGPAEVGLFVWRLRACSVTRAPAFCRDSDRRHFTFSILGNDVPLVTRTVPEAAPEQLAEEANVPGFIRRRAFTERPADWYGPGKSLCVWVGDGEPVPLAAIVPADLTGWRYRPRQGRVAVDPVLGRIAFPSRTAPDSGVRVTYHHAAVADLGGGEYPRPVDPAEPATRYRVGPGGDFDQIMAAVRQWRAEKESQPQRQRAVIELTDSGAYQEQIELRLDLGDRLTLRAAPGRRPVLRLLDWYSDRPDALRVTGTGDGTGGDPPELVLEGLLVTGRSVQVTGPVGRVVLRHCTLVPGWSLEPRCAPEHGTEPSLELIDTPACLRVESSILGSITVSRDEVHGEPNRISLCDSVLDATDPCLAALTAPDDRPAYAVLTARRCTVLGVLRTHAVGTVEESILTGRVLVARRQSGCVRFCWLPTDSRTPPRFHCEPESSGEPERVLPRFTSIRYGTPGYVQLGPGCAEEIRRGAADGAELGVTHDLYQPQREDNLRLRLDEYTPAGYRTGIIFVT